MTNLNIVMCIIALSFLVFTLLAVAGALLCLTTILSWLEAKRRSALETQQDGYDELLRQLLLCAEEQARFLVRDGRPSDNDL